MKKWIVFYASNHGFGHLTRVMAIIERLMEISDLRVSLVSGENQINFARKYLAKYGERIELRSVGIDVGIICHKNSLDVDVERSNREIKKYLNNIDELLEGEVEVYKDRNIEKIIVDISIVGTRLGKRLGIKTTLITNFTWVEQYEYFHMDTKLIKVFEDEYRSCDEIIEYDISLDMKRYGETTETGVLARKINWNNVEKLREQYGEILMVSCGKSANLKNINIKNFSGTIIKTEGIEVVGSENIVELPLTVMNTQDYVAASSLIVTKAGWGTIGEGLVGHTPMILLERDVREDSEMIRILKERNLATSINVRELDDMDYLKWKKIVTTDIDMERLREVEDCGYEVARMIVGE